jgi:hypothetical protein
MYMRGQPRLTIPKRDGFGLIPVNDQNQELPEINIEESGVLRKFEGDPLPENEFERIFVLQGTIVGVQKIENGEVVETTGIVPEEIEKEV